jgi:catechol 2,3-dioxygenase-like lactoylglutathione lyase family enzyme
VITGVHHTGITVSDLERSIAFYHDVLGLDLATEPTPVFSGKELEEGLGVPGASLKLAILKAGNAQVELLQYCSPASPIDIPMPQNSLGAQHVAFLVDDIRATVNELEGKGIAFFSPINVVDEGPLAGWRWIYFSDPDGITLELVQVAYTHDEERRQAVEAYLASRTVQVSGA